MASPAPTPPLNAPADVSPHDHIVVLEDVTWADYQRMLEIRGERPVPRFKYLEGRLEIMTPSRSHESIKSMIGCLVEAWCLENDVDITPYGSWTLEKKDANRGAEPDECYVLGDIADPECPDLAVEVVWTSGGVGKLDVYRKLGVREIWIWRQNRITIHELVQEQYAERAASALLPDLDLGQLLPFIDVHPMTRAVREYRAALRGGN